MSLARRLRWPVDAGALAFQGTGIGVWPVVLAVMALGLGCETGAQTRPIVVGGKSFTEGYLLAEMMAQILEERGFEVRRRTGLGGTLVAFQALQSGEIDVYPEYTGTVSQVILDLDGAVEGA